MCGGIATVSAHSGLLRAPNPSASSASVRWNSSGDRDASGDLLRCDEFVPRPFTEAAPTNRPVPQSCG